MRNGRLMHRRTLNRRICSEDAGVQHACKICTSRLLDHYSLTRLLFRRKRAGMVCPSSARMGLET